MIGGVLKLGRGVAEQRMTDTCRVSRPGLKVWDEPEGVYRHETVTVYEGKCRVKQQSGAARDVEAAGQLLALSQPELHLPVTVPGVMVGDAVVIVASSTSEHLAGRVFRIQSSFDGSQTTALRYRLEVGDAR